MAEDEDDQDMPECIDNPDYDDSSSDEESSEDSDNETDDEDQLHGNIGPPVGCDPPPKQWCRLHGKYVAKEFDVAGEDHPSLYCGAVGCYDQAKKKNMQFFLKTIQHCCILPMKYVQ